MRWCVSIGAVLVTGALLAGDAASMAAPNTTQVQAQKVDESKRVDVELILAVDVSYSMDMDELALQREGYAGAITSAEFLQALKTGPTGKVAVTYLSGQPPMTRRSSCPGASSTVRNLPMPSPRKF